MPQAPQTTPATPTVTIGIPAYNEAAHIERVVRGFLATRYPGLVEVLVADGGSRDGTRAILERLAAEDPRVRMIDNPQRIQSAGLNLMVHAAQGAVFLRADAHCDYGEDYVERSVEALVQSGALNVGGAQRFVAATPFQAGVALAARSVLGSGGAKYRQATYDGYADTVFLGCFWRDALLRASADGQGPFDLEQITNQDAELNARLAELQAHAIYVSSAVRAWYYPRGNAKALWTQYHRYGRGRYLSSRKHPGRAPLRSRLPFYGVSVMGGLVAVDGTVMHGQLSMASWLLIGLSLPFAEALRVSWRHRKDFRREIWRGPERPPSLVTRSLLCALVLTLMPLAHFSGYARQLVRHRLFGQPGW